QHYRGTAAGITGGRRGKARAGRALHRAVIALAANRWRGVVLDHDGLAHLPAGIVAGIHRVPGHGPGIRSATPSRTAIAVQHDRGTAAAVTGCRRGKGRAGWALHRAVIALAAYRWRSVVLDHDGLTHLRAGVVAGIHRVPGHGPGVRSATPSRTPIAVHAYRGTAARGR